MSLPSTLMVERWWPYVVGLGITLLWWKLCDRSFPANASGLLAATGTVASVLVGFLVTAKAIVLGLTGTAVFRKLVATKYTGVFFSYLYEAEIAGIIVLCVSMIGFFVSDTAGATPSWFHWAWMIASLISLLLFVRVVQLLFAFLRSLDS